MAITPQPVAATAPPVLVAQGVTLRFGGATALSEVSVQIRPAELLATLGPNGAAQSPPLNRLSLFYPPPLGSV